MVAIFVGTGAGLARGSGSLLGGAGVLGSAVQGRAGEAISINAANGNLLVAQQDEFLTGRGLDIGISRTYNSLAQMADGDNGDNWQMGTVRRVVNFTGTLNSPARYARAGCQHGSHQSAAVCGKRQIYRTRHPFP